MSDSGSPFPPLSFVSVFFFFLSLIKEQAFFPLYSAKGSHHVFGGSEGCPKARNQKVSFSSCILGWRKDDRNAADFTDQFKRFDGETKVWQGEHSLTISRSFHALVLLLQAPLTAVTACRGELFVQWVSTSPTCSSKPSSNFKTLSGGQKPVPGHCSHKTWCTGCFSTIP